MTQVFNINPFELFDDESIFLKLIYKINSFEEGMDFIKNNNNLSYFTIGRIVRLMFNAFINNDNFPNEEYLLLVIQQYELLFNKKIDIHKLKNIIIKYKHKENTNNVLYLIIRENI